MTDQEFRDRADEALSELQRKLSAASEEYDFDADFNNGALTIEFEEPPTRFVVSPNAPVKQIWVSAHLKSQKLDWDAEAGTFVVGGKTLVDVIQEAVSQQLGEDVEL